MQTETILYTAPLGFWEYNALITPIAPNVYSFDTLGHSLIIQSQGELDALIKRYSINKLIHPYGYPTFSMEIKTMDYTIINPEDQELYGYTRLYVVSLDPYSPINYAAYADNESEALDYVVDYCEDNGYRGYFLDADQESEALADNVGVTYAGNHGLAIDGDNLQIFRVKV